MKTSRVAALPRAFRTLLFCAATTVTTLTAGTGDKVIWGDGDTIRSADLDGANSAPIWPNDGIDVAINTTTGNIYWADNSSLPGTLMTGAHDGTGSAVPVTTTVPGERIHFIAIDPAGTGTAYWCDFITLNVYGFVLPSGPLIPIPSSATNIRGIAVDSRAGKRYLYVYTGFGFWRSDLPDGENEVQVNGAIGDGLPGEFALDTCADAVYVISNTFPRPGVPVPYIRRATLDYDTPPSLTNVTTLLSGVDAVGNTAAGNSDIALDLNAGKMYWTSYNNSSVYQIHSAALDGSGNTVLPVPQGDTYRGITLFLADPACPCGFFREDFDGVAAPNLPGGWTATNEPPGNPLWVTSPIAFDTVPNDAFVDDPATISDKRLDSPGILITSATAQLCFRNNFNMEYDPPPNEVFWDGGVLEVSVNGGPFLDVTHPAISDGTFVTGGYNGVIDGTAHNPLAGQPAWSGDSGGYIDTVISLLPSLKGQTIKLRFRMGTDELVAAPGWRIDTVRIGSVSSGCCGGFMKTMLGNVSTRLLVQTGDNVGIGGFIITGSAPKHVLLRAIGPSLAQFGVPNALADPVLELHGPGAFVTIINNNWRDDPAQEALILATGIPPTDDRESAIDATLAPGAYTAVLRGQNGTTGVALVEIYDVDEEPVSKLANLSTRAFVGTGDNIVIAGVILSNGDGDGRIVLRGIGPSLAAFGISNTLADPTLELRNNNGALLIANNDWQENPDQAVELTAAGLAPPNNLESGIVATLPPGLYTALLAGLNNGVGVGLVEVYDLGKP